MCPSFKPMEILSSYKNFYHTVKNFVFCTDNFVPVMNVITMTEKGQLPSCFILVLELHVICFTYFSILYSAFIVW